MEQRQLLEQYYELFFSCNALYDRWAGSKGLNGNSLMIFYLIWQYPARCTQRLICEKLALPKQTVNSALLALEQKGYIQKRPSPEDKRAKLLAFTEAGRAYAEPILRELFALENQALTAVPEEEKRWFIDPQQHFLQALTPLFFPERDNASPDDAP